MNWKWASYYSQNCILYFKEKEFDKEDFQFFKIHGEATLSGTAVSWEKEEKLFLRAWPCQESEQKKFQRGPWSDCGGKYAHGEDFK